MNHARAGHVTLLTLVKFTSMIVSVSPVEYACDCGGDDDEEEEERYCATCCRYLCLSLKLQAVNKL